MSIRIYKKGEITRLSQHLTLPEFQCRCGAMNCHFTLVSKELVRCFEKVRNSFLQPLNVTSGFRCQEHNSKVGGVANSRHTTGHAVDITTKDSKELDRLEVLCLQVFPFVKRYETFIHCDVRENDFSRKV
ncbi:MAG: D-Ala-D-Ala carboxypeptidase family metallohydrolase [Candidatus Hodarchaeales archaeon]